MSWHSSRIRPADRRGLGVSEQHVASIRLLLDQCTPQERESLFRELRSVHQIHEFEAVIGAPAEMILEAIHRAPELTRRMLRGVIADAAFRQYLASHLTARGWTDVTPVGNFAFDYKLADSAGPITVQVKLQRSERGSPVVRNGLRYGFGPQVFMTETQKSRSGTDGTDGAGNQTRPYRYGEFDVLAVSMQPSTARWDRYMFTLGRWLIQGNQPNEIATLQPVSTTSNEFWTDDFNVAAQWFRAEAGEKRMTVAARPPSNRPARKRLATP